MYMCASLYESYARLSVCEAMFVGGGAVEFPHIISSGSPFLTPTSQ